MVRNYHWQFKKLHIYLFFHQGHTKGLETNKHPYVHHFTMRGQACALPALTQAGILLRVFMWWPFQRASGVKRSTAARAHSLHTRGATERSQWQIAFSRCFSSTVSTTRIRNSKPERRKSNFLSYFPLWLTHAEAPCVSKEVAWWWLSALSVIHGEKKMFKKAYCRFFWVIREQLNCFIAQSMHT